MQSGMQRVFQGDSFYGDWFPRQGDNMIFRIEKIDESLDGGEEPFTEAKFTFYTKNSDDNTDGAVISGKDIAITNVVSGIEQVLIVSTTGTPFGLKELVRWKCVVSSGTDGDWFSVRLFPPLFFNTADGSAA